MNIVHEIVEIMISEDEFLHFSEIYNSLNYKEWQVMEAIKTLVIVGMVVRRNFGGNYMYGIKY